MINLRMILINLLMVNIKFFKGLYMIRFHSFYPWHGSGDYDHLCNSEDREMMAWIKEFK